MRLLLDTSFLVPVIAERESFGNIERVIEQEARGPAGFPWICRGKRPQRGLSAVKQTTVCGLLRLRPPIGSICEMGSHKLKPGNSMPGPRGIDRTKSDGVVFR